MQRYITILYHLLFAGLLLTGFTACNKLLEVPPPPNELGIDQAFGDSASAVAAVSGIYNQMGSNGYFQCGGLSFFTARSADDVICRQILDYFALDSLLYTDTEIDYMWDEGFTCLLTANTCIRALQSTTRLSTPLQHQLLGETLFCRAFINFLLVNIWGDAVPLVTTPDLQANRNAKSVPRQQVYDQILADLLQARELLTNAYPGKSRARPNRMAANALLARVYLYQNRYADAIDQATSVIASNLYLPLPTPVSAFLKDSPEAIWQLMPSVGSGVSGAVADVVLYQRSATSLTPQLLAAFEPGDLRRQAWVVNNVFSGSTYTTANKYKDKGATGNTNPTEYYIIFRLAEQYLIRAEAHVRLGETQAAIDDLNVVRARAGLPALLTTLTQQECMSAVEHERQVELFSEWGHRWLDLRRWPGINNPNITRADEVLGAIKRDWQPTDQWYPVPRSELQANQFLVQNPGYPIK
ncbi:hypothetical protein A4H97_12375 [Niastella yeongjuensis]|uniref:Carbohydrate-binding protein SusD n=1 Tax=Niastella yeongjuensis TaxID=354355 RepID=A0A1V9EA28_9BACT|nr:RagB/SusD family nutrient uptake outer membrane protein [Niastella yeongjuensis]OQP42941.1 hypothetical protein A4H97_12375 [Niastella yeongjuensis]SEO60316.1 Starch-binding associating with outer membrane [Niastella yeongjuensis]